MSKLIICGGQSNMSISLQTEICRRQSRFGVVHASYAGGQAMNTWVVGASAPFTRGVNYDAMVVNALGLTPDRLILNWFQGESDTGNATDAGIWIEKLDALIEFLKVDFGTANVFAVVAKIYPKSDELPPNANWMTIRDGIDTWAAASPLTRRAIETSDLYRPPGNVHLSEWSASGPGSSFDYADRAIALAFEFYL